MPIWKLSKKHLKFFQKEEFTSYLPFSISYLSSLLFFAGSGTIIQVLRIRLRNTGFIRILRSIQFNCRKRRESLYNSRVTDSPPPPHFSCSGFGSSHFVYNSSRNHQQKLETRLQRGSGSLNISKYILSMYRWRNVFSVIHLASH